MPNPPGKENIQFQGLTSNKQAPPPGQDCVDPDVGGHDDDEGEEEDLTVVGGVVDVRPVDRPGHAGKE